MTYSPIVGMHYHPPATAIVRGLAQETNLTLRAEPTNPVDPNAIQVILKPDQIPSDCYENLNQELVTSGLEIDDILQEKELLLGYIPRQVAKSLKDLGIITNEEEKIGKFSISHNGKPMVEFD